MNITQTRRLARLRTWTLVAGLTALLIVLGRTPSRALARATCSRRTRRCTSGSAGCEPTTEWRD